jgi:hypothetical protein
MRPKPRREKSPHIKSALAESRIQRVKTLVIRVDENDIWWLIGKQQPCLKKFEGECWMPARRM